MERKVLITGGVKSGKSRFAIKIARQIEEKEKTFIATAKPIDGEMRDKIKMHSEERGEDFKTVEEPLEIGSALRSISSSVTVIDCLTLWLSNLFFSIEEEEKKLQIDSFLQEVGEFEENIVIVTNEVGSGIIPDNKISRKYQVELGRLNQDVARICDEVYVVISGIPVKIK